MHTVTIAVDLAKNVFELAVANQSNHVSERRRLSRPRFELVLLPPHHVRGVLLEPELAILDLGIEPGGSLFMTHQAPLARCGSSHEITRMSDPPR